jgi:hypothetical protein
VLVARLGQRGPEGGLLRLDAQCPEGGRTGGQGTCGWVVAQVRPSNRIGRAQGVYECMARRRVEQRVRRPLAQGELVPFGPDLRVERGKRPVQLRGSGGVRAGRIPPCGTLARQRPPPIAGGIDYRPAGGDALDVEGTAIPGMLRHSSAWRIARFCAGGA